MQKGRKRGGEHDSARDMQTARDTGSSFCGREHRGKRRGSTAFLEQLLFVQRHEENFFTEALHFAVS